MDDQPPNQSEAAAYWPPGVSGPSGPLWQHDDVDPALLSWSPKPPAPLLTPEPWSPEQFEPVHRALLRPTSKLAWKHDYPPPVAVHASSAQPIYGLRPAFPPIGLPSASDFAQHPANLFPFQHPVYPSGVHHHASASNANAGPSLPPFGTAFNQYHGPLPSLNTFNTPGGHVIRYLAPPPPPLPSPPPPSPPPLHPPITIQDLVTTEEEDLASLMAWRERERERELSMQPFWLDDDETADIPSVWVNPVCGVQTLESRFGPRARRPIYDALSQNIADQDAEFSAYATGNNELGGPDEADESDEFEDVSDNDVDSILVHDGHAPIEDGMDPEVLPQPPIPPTPALPPPPQNNTHYDQAYTGYPSHVPQVARARMNLTALSQNYNLYFAASQGRVHIHHPQPAPEILRDPLLTLCPPPSAMASHVIARGGCLDPRLPHQINHLIVGNLGGLEILLLAYDDGDVVAYYTHVLARHAEAEMCRHRRRRLPAHGPKPFFHETVGDSAWGLAIHAQSRLIAVSSNMAEINVFAFALQQPASPPSPIGADDWSPPTFTGLGAAQLEASLRRRDCNMRLLLPLGPSGSNVPSIAFVSAADGNAECILATDIRAALWALPLWKVGTFPVKLPAFIAERGWGVLPIPTADFLTTMEMPEAIPGASYRGIATVEPVDIAEDNIKRVARKRQPTGKTRRSRHSPTPSENNDDDEDDDNLSFKYCDDDVDNSDHGAWSQTGGANWFLPAPSKEDDSDSDWDGQAEEAFATQTTTLHCWDEPVNRGHRLTADGKNRNREFQVVCPSLGIAWSDLTPYALFLILRSNWSRRDATKERDGRRGFGTADAPFLLRILRRYAIFRTYMVTTELLRLPMRGDLTVQGDTLLVSQRPRRLPPPLQDILVPWDMGNTFVRCNMLHYVPALRLVIVGSAQGTVTLLRPIRGPNVASTNALRARYRFRVEWALPLPSDATSNGIPTCCLLGCAISPVPAPGDDGPLLRLSGKPEPTRKKRKFRKTRDADDTDDEDDADDANGALPTSKTDARCWRLILHYMDHTILQYYIAATKPANGDAAIL